MSERKDTTSQERELPEGARIITKKLLEDAIRQAEKRDDITVQDFTVSWATKPGDNMASVVLRIKANVHDDSGESEHHLILKTIKDNKEMSEMIRKAGIYKKEIGAYAELMPAYVSFQQESVDAPIIPSVPKFYFGQDYLENQPGVVIVEDLSPKGYRMGKVNEGLDYEHCKLVMKELARMHALSLALKKRNPENMKEKFEFVFSEAQLGSVLGPMLESFIKPSIGSVVSVVKASNANDDLKRRAAKLLEIENPTATMRNLIQPTEQFAVVCHGDPWCNNFLFKYEQQNGKEVPVDVKLIDLQIVRYALPTTDLSYFLFMSTNRGMRKDHLADLLKLYHATFMGVLQKVKFECPEFTIEVLEEMYKKTAMFGVLMACMALPYLQADPEIFTELDKLTPDEVSTQMDDVNAMAFSTPSSMVTDKLVGLIEDCIELGIL